MEKIFYTLGFFFDKSKRKVALIKKNKPKWQHGYLNGIGGKMEPYETILQTQQREFEEETGVFVKNWNYFMNKIGKDFEVYCFYAIDENNDFKNLRTTTEEEVVIVPVHDIDTYNVLPNLRWMVKLIFDKDVVFPLNIYYK